MMLIQQAQPKRMRMAGIELSKTSPPSHECGGCGKRIRDRYLLKAVDLYWHEDCLKCGCCDCRLGEVGSSLYKKANLLLCKRDYLRLFGTTGHCAACNKVIPAFEMVMRAKSNVYHLECFACQQCNHRFCVGDRFYLCENKILCEYDYEERLVFANMSYSSDSLAHIKRQVGGLQTSDDSSLPPPHPPPPPNGGAMYPHGPTPVAGPSMVGSVPHSTPSNPAPPSDTPSDALPPSLLPPNSPYPPSMQGVGSHPIPAGGHANAGGGGNPTQGGGVPGALPPTPNGGGDDASSGYGSPDSLTMEDR